MLGTTGSLDLLEAEKPQRTVQFSASNDGPVRWKRQVQGDSTEYKRSRLLDPTLSYFVKMIQPLL